MGGRATCGHGDRATGLDSTRLVAMAVLPQGCRHAVTHGLAFALPLQACMTQAARRLAGRALGKTAVVGRLAIGRKRGRQGSQGGGSRQIAAVGRRAGRQACMQPGRLAGAGRNTGGKQAAGRCL